MLARLLSLMAAGAFMLATYSMAASVMEEALKTSAVSSPLADAMMGVVMNVVPAVFVLALLIVGVSSAVRQPHGRRPGGEGDAWVEPPSLEERLREVKDGYRDGEYAEHELERRIARVLEEHFEERDRPPSRLDEELEDACQGDTSR